MTQAALTQWTTSELKTFLEEENWRLADEITLWLMLQATDRLTEGWLDVNAIANLPCSVLHELDYLWAEASQGHFGFSTQRQIYTAEAEYETFQLGQQTGWLMFRTKPLAFFKLYRSLNFSLDAPRGHLPALWYWKIPWATSWAIGSFGAGRGLGYGDHRMFDAMMLRLERCSLI